MNSIKITPNYKIVKHLVFALFVIFSFNFLSAQEKATTSSGDLTFMEDVINYGKIEKGAHGERVFKFTNTGSEPVVISQVKSTCGCTVPAFTKIPIMPGAEGEITVTYDTKRVGAFTKTITVVSNAKSQNMKLIIKGEILREES